MVKDEVNECKKELVEHKKELVKSKKLEEWLRKDA